MLSGRLRPSAALARQALIHEMGPQPVAGIAPASEERAPFEKVVKITRWLRHAKAVAA